MSNHSPHISGSNRYYENAREGQGVTWRVRLRCAAKRLSAFEACSNSCVHCKYNDHGPHRQRQALWSSAAAYLIKHNRVDQSQTSSEVFRRCNQEHATNDGRQAHGHRWLQWVLQYAGLHHRSKKSYLWLTITNHLHILGLWADFLLWNFRWTFRIRCRFIR